VRGVDVYWLPPESIHCPEPSCWLLLVSGAGLLSVLHRWRR
jgi:hypothetical protein